MPSSAALASAPSFILTKTGLVSVFVIRHAVTEWLPAKAAPESAVKAIAEVAINFS